MRRAPKLSIEKGFSLFMKKKFALLGRGIDYSLSPEIHRMIYEHMGIDAEYNLLSAEPDRFAAMLSELFALDGFNVTQPYKRRIVDFLDSIEGDWDAVNTVVQRGGKRIGFNTDEYGFRTHFEKFFAAEGHEVLVLGAGGLAETVVPYLVKSGAKVYVYNRTFKNAAGLAEKYGAEAIKEKSGTYAAVINCSSFGLKSGENPAEGIDFGGTILAYDANYVGAEFLKTADAAGVPFTTDGLEMLVYQAIRADELFFDTEIADKDGLALKILERLKKDKG